ncbi:hypothetical protein D018_2944B, partial [Vibrio parahaemolyticus VP2007-007]
LQLVHHQRLDQQTRYGAFLRFHQYLL